MGRGLTRGEFVFCIVLFVVGLLTIIGLAIFESTTPVAHAQRGDRYTPEVRLAYYAVDTAANDTYVARVAGISSYRTGLFVLLNPVTDNTGACTLNINNMGAKSLKTVSGNNPGDSHVDASQIVPLCYDGTNFVIMINNANARSLNLVTYENELVFFENEVVFTY